MFLEVFVAWKEPVKKKNTETKILIVYKLFTRTLELLRGVYLDNVFSKRPEEKNSI